MDAEAAEDTLRFYGELVLIMGKIIAAMAPHAARKFTPEEMAAIHEQLRAFAPAAEKMRAPRALVVFDLLLEMFPPQR